MKPRLLVVLACVLTSSLHAANPAQAVGREVKRYGSDAWAIARAPLTWDAATWRKIGVITAADAAAFAADESIADFVQRNRSGTTDDIARAVTPFGGGRGTQVAAATLLFGLVTHNAEVRDIGRDAIEASIFASGIVTPALKRVAGRSRPFAGEGAFAFDPFSGNTSFPSGHATNAFAIASVFAGHARGRVVPAIAYTLATAVVVARMNDDVHFASDVIAGAAIGTAMGRSIVARHRPQSSKAPSRVSWMIVPTRGGVAFGLSLAVK